MYEFRLSTRCAAETDVGTACLEIKAVGAGRNFTVLVLCRHPYFEIIGLGRGETDIASAQAYNMIRKFQTLQHLICFCRKGFQIIPAVIRLAVFHNFHFMELVLTDNASGIYAC